MSTRICVVHAWSVIASTAIACALVGGNAGAAQHTVIDTIRVSTRGLDLSRSSDARKLYLRLTNAAYVLCTRGTRVGLEPVDNFKTCYGQALGSAIRSASAPMLTQVYLETHTLNEAVAQRIEVPAQLAAK